ncbi:MAG: MFS transporter [Chloroflexota bacterium]
MRPLSAIRTFYLTQFSYRLFFGLMLAVSAIYRVDVIGLNPLQLVLVGATLEITFLVAEIPTGVVADAYSRKLSLIIGYIIIGIGFIIEGLIPEFWAVLVSQVVWGVGATFLSGAEIAWLADEVGEENLAGILVRGNQLGAAVGVLGILLAMGLGSIDLSLGFLIAGVGLIVLGLILIPLMPETGFEPTAVSERSTWGKLMQTFRAGLDFVRQNKALQLIMIIELCIGFSDEGIQRLTEPLLLEEFTFPQLGGFEPIVWLGGINIVNSLLGIALLELLRRRIEGDGPATILRNFRLFYTLSGLAIVVYAYSVNFTMAVVMYIVYGQLVRLAFPLYDAWIPQQIDKQVRATVMSMWNQLNSLGQIIGGPAIGLLATATTLRFGYAMIAVFLIPVPFLVTAILRQNEAK